MISVPHAEVHTLRAVMVGMMPVAVEAVVTVIVHLLRMALCRGLC